MEEQQQGVEPAPLGPGRPWEVKEGTRLEPSWKNCSGGFWPVKATSKVNPSGQRCDGTSLGVQGLRSHTSTAEAMGSTPCRGTKTPTCQVVQPKKKKKDVRGQTEYTSRARSPRR